MVIQDVVIVAESSSAKSNLLSDIPMRTSFLAPHNWPPASVVSISKALPARVGRPRPDKSLEGAARCRKHQVEETSVPKAGAILATATSIVELQSYLRAPVAKSCLSGIVFKGVQKAHGDYAV